MPKAAFYGLPHSESEVYFVKSSTIELAHCGWFQSRHRCTAQC